MATPSRIVRVFISSTFRDFIQERDELVKKVFPELRRRCRQRFVDVIEVDLRWGITAEQAESGQVLPICLSEIDKCRPFFIGLLGERYGWVPGAHAYEAELLARMPWLQEHAGGKSVTELEMLHGVLNNPNMAGRALFYFRDRAWSQNLGSDGIGESPADGLRLEDLKQRIRTSGFPVVEGYENPAHVAGLVLESLWELIDKAFPIGEVPTGEELIDWAHADFANSRLAGYIPRPAVLTSIDTAFESANAVVVVGAAGCGKSSVLADWYNRRANAGTDACWYHAIGGAADSAHPQSIQRRLLRWLVKLGHCDSAALADERGYTRAISAALTQADAARAGLTLVIDSLDQLDHPTLDWLPTVFPRSVRVLVSSQPGFFEKEFSARKWGVTGISPLDFEETRDVARAYLGRYRKALSPAEERLVLEAPGASNPLFLRVLLDELRQVGTHENLAAQISHYAGDPRLEELFGKIFCRLEADFGHRLVSRLFGLLRLARSGLSESELQRLLRRPNGEERLPRALLVPFLGAVDEFLTLKTGRISIFHATLARVASVRYAAESPAELHRSLGAFFAELAPDHPRRLSEEVFHWTEAYRLGDEACLETLDRRIGDYGYCFEKIAAGFLEDCAADFERLAATVPGVFSDWVRFMRYRMATLREPRGGATQQELHLQLALEDGEDSPVTHAARAWTRRPTRAFSVAHAAPSLFATPDPYEALHRHPLCPAPKDLRGHASSITGWLLLSSGDAVSWSRDPFVLGWSLTCEKPLRRIAGFAEGTLGALESAAGDVWFWGLGGALKIWTPGTDAVLDKSFPATLEGARISPRGEMVLWDMDGRIFVFAGGALEPAAVVECGREVVGVYFGKDAVLVHTPDGMHAIENNALGRKAGGEFRPALHMETPDGDLLVGEDGVARIAGDGALEITAFDEPRFGDVIRAARGVERDPLNPLKPSDLTDCLARARNRSGLGADALLMDWPLESLVHLQGSSGKRIPWRSRSAVRPVWSHPPSDLHLVATQGMLVPVRTLDEKGGSDV